METILLILAIWSSNFTAPAKDLIIVDKPIVFDEVRRELSLKYIQEHHGLTLKEPVIEPKIIVIHHTAIPTFEGTFRAFNPPLLPGNRKEIQSASALNVSTQFVVDRDGTIYRFLPETTFARHVIGLNYCSIGVENVGGTPETPLTKAQLKANIQLVSYLAEKYDIEYLIGHHEYQDFRHTDLWKESDPNYLTEKSDPGIPFMQKLRRKVRRYHLAGPPQP